MYAYSYILNICLIALLFPLIFFRNSSIVLIHNSWGYITLNNPPLKTQFIVWNRTIILSNQATTKAIILLYQLLRVKRKISDISQNFDQQQKRFQLTEQVEHRS